MIWTMLCYYSCIVLCLVGIELAVYIIIFLATVVTVVDVVLKLFTFNRSVMKTFWVTEKTKERRIVEKGKRIKIGHDCAKLKNFFVFNNFNVEGMNRSRARQIYCISKLFVSVSFAFPGWSNSNNSNNQKDTNNFTHRIRREPWKYLCLSNLLSNKHLLSV